ncbi:MAG: ShET2/EspL2 family type III secretion system effector toxin [Neisseriaceae bacterium]
MNLHTQQSYNTYISSKNAQIKNSTTTNSNFTYFCIDHNKANSTLFYSKGDSHIDNNGKAQDKYSEQIVCRHLSYAWLIDKKLEKTNWRESFSSIDTIKTHPYLLNNLFDTWRVKYRADYYEIFSCDTFGQDLYHAIQDIKVCQSISILTYSENHLMAIEVEYKDNPKRYIIKFFDPNKTLCSKRLIFDNLGTLKNLTIKDFVYSQELVSLYLPKHKAGVLAIYNNINILPK